MNRAGHAYENHMCDIFSGTVTQIIHILAIFRINIYG